MEEHDNAPPPPSIVDIRQQDEPKPVKTEGEGDGGEAVPQAPTAVYQQNVSAPLVAPMGGGVAGGGAAPAVAESVWFLVLTLCCAESSRQSTLTRPV
jgi:hypothetical protein